MLAILPALSCVLAGVVLNGATEGTSGSGRAPKRLSVIESEFGADQGWDRPMSAFGAVRSFRFDHHDDPQETWIGDPKFARFVDLRQTS